MCGIAGLMALQGASPSIDVLSTMADQLQHRGPDGRGHSVMGDTGLIQTRLAVIDLAGGDQPLFLNADNEQDRLTLVANGEIYNYRELKSGDAPGDYLTHSDCEPPLYLYQKYGIDYAIHLRGMYAIAIHDGPKNRLVISRDPFGIKPLYYGINQDGFVFASQPSAFTKTGLATPTLNKNRALELLQLQFSTGRETLFNGIYRVMPGETLVVEGGHVTESFQVAALPTDEPLKVSVKDALKQLDQTFEESVDFHQRSDVPYGMFLSGGVDSSALLTMMARLNDRPVETFTAGFSGTDVADERDHAKTVAQSLGANNTCIDYGAQDFWTTLPEIARIMDDPAADYALLPTYKLAAAAKNAGLKVVLSGEGGDELFAGYGRYRRASRARVLGGRPMRQSGALDALGVLKNDGQGWRDGITQQEQNLPPYLTELQKNQVLDCHDWLPNDLLLKLDRTLMAHGVEGRVPFLDAKMADFAFRLPDNLKNRRGHGKWILRKWLEKHLAVSQPFSSKKGFTVPVAGWIADKAQHLAPLVAHQPGVEQLCHGPAVENLFISLANGPQNKHIGKAAWHLLFYSLWHQSHIMGIKSGGDVFETLTEI